LEIATPIQAELFRSNLLHHEDQQYANWILRGLTEGFRIGFRRSGVVLVSSQTNMLSAMAQEVQAGSNSMCQPSGESSGDIISPFGVTPKKGRANC